MTGKESTDKREICEIFNKTVCILFPKWFQSKVKCNVNIVRGQHACEKEICLARGWEYVLPKRHLRLVPGLLTEGKFCRTGIITEWADIWEYPVTYSLRSQPEADIAAINDALILYDPCK